MPHTLAARTRKRGAKRSRKRKRTRRFALPRRRARPDYAPERAFSRRRAVIALEVETLVRTLSHDLHACFEGWGALPRRRHLESDVAFGACRAQVGHALQGVGWDLRQASGTPHQPDRVRAIAWNVERGKRFDALRGALLEDPRLANADLLLLTEVDMGMERSGNRHVAQELAESLGMGFVFANFHLVLSRGDRGEQDVVGNNGDAMHGCALLTRLPVTRVASVPLPEFRDKFHSLEKRLGCKRALLCELMLPDGPLTVVVVHLDPFSPPRHRARQMRRILGALEKFRAGPRVLLGGDLNTTTTDMGGAAGWAVDLAKKMMRFGFAGTIANYMTPERIFERGLMQSLTRAGLSTDGFVDPETPTLYYDLNDPEIIDKTLDVAGRRFVGWLQRRMEPFGGTVPMRLDWFAGRELSPLRAWTVERPRYQGQRIADHNPIGVEIACGGRPREH